MKIFLLFILLTFALYGQSVSTLSFDRFTHYGPDDWISYGSANYITSIDMGYDVIYFGTRNGGVLRFDLFSNRWLYPLTTSQGLRSNKILRLAYDLNSSQLYARTDMGVDVYNPGFRFWKQSSEMDMPAPNRLPLPEGRNKNALFAPYNRPAISAFPNFFTNRDISLYSDGNIIGPYGNNFKITDRLVDINNFLWIGTNGLGIGRANLIDQHATFKRRYLSDMAVNDVLIKNNTMWIAGPVQSETQPEIIRWNSKKNIWNYYKTGHTSAAIFSDRINVLEQSSNNTIYLGTSQGIFAKPYRKDWKSLLYTVLGDYKVFDIKSHDGQTFVGTDNGIFKIDDTTLSVTQVKRSVLLDVPISKITLKGTHVYLGSDRGIFDYDEQNETIAMLKMPTAISTNYISALAINKDSLWFSGAFGIGVYNIKTHAGRSFPLFNNNPFNTVSDIAVTEFFVWFATDKGLLKYDPDRDYWYLYTTEDGLIDNRINHIDVQGDYLWLSTNRGLTRFRWYNGERYE